MTYKKLGKVKTFCKDCSKEFETTITVGYWDYKSNDIFISGGAPSFDEPAKTNSFITENFCRDCDEKRQKEHEIYDYDYD